MSEKEETPPQDVLLNSTYVEPANGTIVSLLSENSGKPSGSKTDSDIDDDFTWFNIICFAAAGMPYHLMHAAIGVYANKFLLDEVKIMPKNTSIILFLSGAIDAITDPIYGYLINMSPVTRIGKMKPWIIISVPLTIIMYLLLWYKPDFESQIGLVAWCTMIFSLFYTFVTGYRIPHTSMTMFISKSKHKRELATVCRMGFEMAGILLALILQGVIIGNRNTECIFLSSNLTETSTDKNLISLENMMKSIESDEATGFSTIFNKVKFLYESQKYFVAAVIFMIIYFFCMVLFFVGTKEDLDLHKQLKTTEKRKKRAGFKDISLVLKFKPFLLLAGAAVLTTTSVQIVQAYFQLFFVYSFTNATKYFTVSIIVLLALSVLLVPLWKFLMTKFGKRPAYIAGNMLLIPLLVGSIFFKEENHIYIYFPLAVLASNTITVSFLLPWSMLPECMDAFFLTHNLNCEAFFYTFFTVGAKITISLYLGIGQSILDVAGGYQTSVCAESQPKSVNYVIRSLFIPVPIVLLIISSILVYLYPITEQKVKENAEKLENKETGQVNLGSQISYLRSVSLN